MSDTVVLYKSKHGTTKQYAEWIAEDLRADISEASSFPGGAWEKYSKVIYCGSMYANSVKGLRLLARYHSRLRGKKIIVVGCGLSYPHIVETIQRIVNGMAKQLPKGLHANVRLFLVRGAVCYSKLGIFEKMILKMLETTLRKRDPNTLNPEEQEMLGALGKDFSFVDRSMIQPILDYHKKL